MKKILFALFICIISFHLSGQVIYYDGHGNVIGGSHIRTKPGKPLILVDSLTNNRFVLDSAHIFITAYDKNGKILWKTDPFIDNSLEEYRTKRPFIVNFQFTVNHWCSKGNVEDGTKVIWINYINTQAGYIETKSGKFHFCGQD
jgi:hypothetical protein